MTSESQTRLQEGQRRTDMDDQMLKAYTFWGTFYVCPICANLHSLKSVDFRHIKCPDCGMMTNIEDQNRVEAQTDEIN